MGDIIRFEDKFCLRFVVARRQPHSRSLVRRDVWCVRYGDIETVGQGQLGLFCVETRHLSRMTLRLDGQTPLLLACTVRDDNAFLLVDLTNVDIGMRPDIPRGTVHLYQSKFLGEGICYEQFPLTNCGPTLVRSLMPSGAGRR